MKRVVARLIASGLGSGYSPVAPGTAGSAVALGFGALLLMGPDWALPLAIAASIAVGLWSIGVAGGTEDPGWVVIDEFAGQWIALLPMIGLALQPAWRIAALIAAFALFRLFDITKPGPIGWADRQAGAIGVMADDVLAGALAAVLLWAFRLWAMPPLWRILGP